MDDILSSMVAPPLLKIRRQQYISITKLLLLRTDSVIPTFKNGGDIIENKLFVLSVGCLFSFFMLN